MFKSQFKIFSEVENLLFRGKLDLALKKVEEIEKKNQLDNDQKIACNILKSNLFYEQKKYELSLDYANKSFNRSLEIGNQFFIIDSLLIKVRNKLKLKKFEECDFVLNQIRSEYKKIKSDDKTNSIFHQQKAILLLCESEFFQNSGNLDQALKQAEESLNLFGIIKYNYGKAEAYTNIANIMSTQGELNKALDFLEKSLLIWDQIENKRNYAINLMNIGNIYTDKGELEQALRYFQQCFEICKQINEKQTIANSLGSIGINHAMRGELDKALEYFQESLEICEQINDKQILAKNLGSIGIIHHSKGELNEALDYYKRSLKMNREIGNIDGEVIFLGNIGEIHRLKGDLDKALNCYQESLEVYNKIGGKSIPMALALVNSGLVYQQKGEAKKALEYLEKGLEIFKDSGNIRRMAEVYFFQIPLLIDIDQLEEAEKILVILQEFNKQNNDKLIKQMTRICEALLLKTSKRVRNRAKAEELLIEVVNEEVINFEVYLEALINLSDLYLIELQLSGDEEALKELKELMEKQLALAKEQKSSSLLVATYFLQAQIALVELDIRKAQYLLNQSQLIAEEKGLQKAAMKISSEYDYYFEEQEIWKEFSEEKTPISERVSHTSLEETIMQMIKKRVIEPPKFVDENPVLLLIVSEQGIPLFSQSFNLDSKFDDLLVGGFLTAINSFMQEAFATAGSIERIKHQDYTLVLQSKDSLRFCYVFKGPSYGAMNKLSNFIDQLEMPSQSKIIQALNNKIDSQKIEQSIKSELENLGKEIFLPTRS